MLTQEGRWTASSLQSYSNVNYNYDSQQNNRWWLRFTKLKNSAKKYFQCWLLIPVLFCFVNAFFYIVFPRKSYSKVTITTRAISLAEGSTKGFLSAAFPPRSIFLVNPTIPLSLYVRIDRSRLNLVKYLNNWHIKS